MKTILTIAEDDAGNVVGAFVGTQEAPEFVAIDEADRCPRSELAIRAADLCAKYRLAPSPKMQEALARALTAPVPDGA